MKPFQKQTRMPPVKTPWVGQKPNAPLPGGKGFIPNNRQGRRAQGKQKRR